MGGADSGALWRRHPRCCAGFVRPGRTALFGEPCRGLRGLRRGLTRVAVGCQYSSARMMVRTRVVTAGSAGSASRIRSRGHSSRSSRSSGRRPRRPRRSRVRRWGSLSSVKASKARTFARSERVDRAGMASTPAVIMTAPPTKVRRKASLRARMRSALERSCWSWLQSLEVGGWMGARLVHGHARKEEGRPAGRPSW